jgi:hypothetical protein
VNLKTGHQDRKPPTLPVLSQRLPTEVVLFVPNALAAPFAFLRRPSTLLWNPGNGVVAEFGVLFAHLPELFVLRGV